MENNETVAVAAAPTPPTTLQRVGAAVKKGAPAAAAGAAGVGIAAVALGGYERVAARKGWPSVFPTARSLKLRNAELEAERDKAREDLAALRGGTP